MSTSGDAEVAIVGLGVIGGSIALRLRERGSRVVGFSTSAADCADAATAGVTVAPTVDDAVRDVGLVLVAVPLNHICRVSAQVIGAAPSRTTILHAGSLQRAEALRTPPEIAPRLIGTHPLAGSHKSGFSGARADLFRDATVYVEQRADARQRADAELFWSMAGARHIEYATAAAHDDAMALISHLPQLASTALGATVSDLTTHRPDEGLTIQPGPGARDATRLALSALDMWQPLLEGAPRATVDGLRALEQNIHRLRVALEEGNWTALSELWERAQAWRMAAGRGERT